MNFAAVYHRSTPDLCYSPDGENIIVNLRTDRDIDAAYIVWEDPFIHELHRKREWFGKREKMTLSRELAFQVIYTAKVRPRYKRLMYYFELEADGKTYALFENKLCPKEEMDAVSKQFFKYAWLNPSDVIAPPAWVGDAVWYQIMPDRFCRHHDAPQNDKFRKWGDFSHPSRKDVYGGTLKGITERLDYLRELGVSGIYMTPIFQSDSNHKYNTYDYTKIDEDFGTEDDLRELIAEAHKRGIRVMLDAVFNHCGIGFAPCVDVMEKGRGSQYFDWFFINSDDFAKNDFSTADGRFYSFSFWAGMPKLNTNNPEVVKYFSDLCCYWAREWDIDGIRFDVGDEISHSFIRALRTAVKAVKPDIYLLGEIWMDSLNWLSGDEYDAVMNYPFTGCVNDFWKNESLTVTDFMHAMNYCHSLYPEQVNRAMLNFLDTHDTARAAESSKNNDVLLQKLAVLLTMTGSPCLYYGTEIAMKGLYTPYNRSCMPWKEIDRGNFSGFTEKVRQLLALRKALPELRGNELHYEIRSGYPRLLQYTKGGSVRVLINAGQEDIRVDDLGEILFANGFCDGWLRRDGIVILS
ncbi:Glycosidase [Ruminococcaceae bacterium P7]|nr:Glycosidase [Ruminococcaceae bacterium P7]